MIDLETAHRMPLVAILRGLRPDEAVQIVEALANKGFTLVEIPLNSPDPLVSLSKLAKAFGDRVVLGAGTVLTATQVQAVHDAGGRLVVAPNFDPRVGAACRERDMLYGPGIATMTEAFAALEAGATFLKIFPAELVPPSGVKAMRAVLPGNALVFPVGGIVPDRAVMEPYIQAGANGFGLGSALYKPGMTPEQVSDRAKAFIAAWDALTPSAA